MPLAHAAIAKLAVGATAAAVLVGGTATVAVRGNEAPAGGLSRHPGASADADALTDGPEGMEVVVDPVTGTARLVPRTGGTGATAGAATGAKGAPGAGGQLSVGTPLGSSPGQGGASVGAGGRTGGSTGAGGSIGASPGGSGGSGGGGSGGGSGGSTSPGGGGGVTTPGVPGVSAPGVPSAPQGVSAHSRGSFTLVVPGTDKVSKKLCLSGTAANRCQTITVPALRPVELTLSFTGNAGMQAPSFSNDPCPGSRSITVSGLTPGATVKVTANGRQLSATVPERGAGQTASLCDD
ncbi:MAG TPA: hypothetical protein VHG90_13675 [Acidimicrobiales bacterium]|nr:hypothetical protein [Acidimicrobiales bacterium]